MDELASRFADALGRALDQKDELLLCCRVIFEGRGSLHTSLLQQPEDLEASMRAKSFDVSADSVWIERTIVETSPPQDVESLKSRADALGLLFRSVTNESCSNGQRPAIHAEIARLAERLPKEMLLDIPILNSAAEGDLEPLIAEAQRLVTTNILGLEVSE